MFERIAVSTSSRCQLIDITGSVNKILDRAKIKDGMLYIYCPHTTAAVVINENCDPSVQDDISKALEKIIPHKGPYAHTEGNSDAHIKAAIIGSSRTLFVESGKIAFGSWQGIYLCEFDGPRTREVWVKTLKEA